MPDSEVEKNSKLLKGLFVFGPLDYVNYSLHPLRMKSCLKLYNKWCGRPELVLKGTRRLVSFLCQFE